MGETEVKHADDPERLRTFMRKVLEDVQAFEQLLEGGHIESGVSRIGAEQEFFLVDRNYRPAPKAIEVLEAIDDPHFTTELARFNLEANLDPLELGERTLQKLHQELERIVSLARRGAREVGAEVVLTGILPTLEKSDLGLENITPKPRYYALADAVRRLRDGEFGFRIKGRDELVMTHDSVMAEACNTSFQLHFQVDPGNFARLYNVAQALAGPTLAAATNSPLLFGKRLWRETRIAVFQQSVDTRHHPSHHRQEQPRVSFGRSWIDDSVLEIFREDIARFRLLVSTDIEENPFEKIARGEAPKLKALCLHNGTIYRWNRPCYGILHGKPHLRIENRILPAGPSILDEVANAAFWFGAVKALADEVGDIRRRLAFDEAKENFLASARLGLDAQLHWLDGTSMPAGELVCKELLPRARQGLRDLGISAADADRYINVVEERVASRQTGSLWLLRSLAEMDSEGTELERLACLTESIAERQERGEPVHTWPRAELRRSRRRRKHYSRVGSLMTTDLFTVNENDVIDLVANVMDWKHIRHVPVESNDHRLVGLVTHRTLLRSLVQHRGEERQPTAVRDVMQFVNDTATTETNTLEAIQLMRRHRIACLPVEEKGRLVGILTERDFMRISAELLERFLGRKYEEAEAEAAKERAEAEERAEAAEG